MKKTFRRITSTIKVAALLLFDGILFLTILLKDRRAEQKRMKGGYYGQDGI